jgi:hypothetical protein
VCHHILGPLTFAEAVLANQYAFGTLGVDPSGRAGLKLSRAGQNVGLGQPMGQGIRRELQEKALAELPYVNNPRTRSDEQVAVIAGSIRTIIAAEMTGRACYAVEIDPVYVDVSIARWENFTGQRAAILDGKRRRSR